MTSRHPLTTTTLLLALAALPATSSAQSSHVGPVHCGEADIQLVTDGGPLRLDVLFESTCPQLDLEGEIRVLVGGVPVSAPRPLDASDSAHVVVRLTPTPIAPRDGDRSTGLDDGRIVRKSARLPEKSSDGLVCVEGTGLALVPMGRSVKTLWWSFRSCEQVAQ